MNRYQIPYHKSIHDRLVRTILIPTLAISLVLIVVVPVMVGLAVNTENARRNRREAEAFSQGLAVYRDGAGELARDPLIREYLRTGAGERQVYETLYGFRNRQGGAVGFQLSSTDGARQARDASGAVSVQRYEGVRDVMLLWKLQEADGPVEHLILERPGLGQDRAPVFAVAVPVEEGEERLGMLTFLFTREDLRRMLTDANHALILTNQNNHVAFANGVSLEFPYSKFAPRQVFWSVYEADGQYFIIHQAPLADSSLQLYSLSSFNFVLPLVYIESALAAVLLALITLLIYRVSSQATRVVTAPFDQVFTALKQYGEGNTLCRIPVDQREELAPYLSQFNAILDEIDRLLQKNRDLAEENRTAEQKILQSQFNPHFMFNMLDTIKYMIGDDPAQAQRMVLTLSKMLRYTLDRSGEELVPLGRDLQYIEDYLRLQQVRLGEDFSYELDIPPEAMDCRVPKLILQPLIENSIGHGYTGEVPFRLTVGAALHRGRLQLTVRDNGRGIPPAQLRNLRARLRDGAEDSRHIGIVNTQKRLQLQYGPEYGMKIESQAGKGATVRLNLKAVKGG